MLSSSSKFLRLVKNPSWTRRSLSFLSDDQIHIQRVASEIAKNDLEPVAREIDENRRIPDKIFQVLKGSNLLSVCVKSDYGGLGLDTLSLSLVVEELSTGCSSTGSMVSIHNCLYANLVQRKGTQDQIKEFLQPIVLSGDIGVFALSEADAGSDVASLSTKATKDNNNWILNGRKTWVTSAALGKYGIIFATVDKNKYHKGITAFIVPMKDVIIEREEEKLGIRGTSTCSVTLEDVKVPESNILGHVGEGFRIAMEQLETARIGIASQALGIARASINRASIYMKQNYKFDQFSKMKLAEMAIKYHSAQLLTRLAAKRKDELPNENHTKFSSMAKVAASESATFNSHSAMQIMGFDSSLTKNSIERLFRDARITEIYGGVTDIQKLVIADQVLRGL